MRIRKLLRLGVAVAAVAAVGTGLSLALLGGCAATTPSGPDVRFTDEATHDVPVLQVERGGGFAPIWALFEEVPILTVYADGLAVSHGPQIAIFPAPALPNLQVHELNDSELATLIDLAATAGLLSEPPDYGEPPVADASTTVLALQVDGATYVHAAYALGIEPPPGMAEELPTRIDEAAQRARETLSTFIDEAIQFVMDAGKATMYEPDAFAVIASAVPADGATPDPAEPGVEPTTKPWPIDTRLEGASFDDAGDCLIIDGDEADVLRIALAEANTLTRFDQDGQVYDVAVRPLLPGESDCPTPFSLDASPLG